MTESGAVCADVSRVYGVVVTFEPNYERLALVLEAVAGQVDSLLVVDNSVSVQGQKLCETACESTRKFLLGESADKTPTIVRQLADNNIGLSAAYNLAVERAGSEDADYLLLLDQDSVVSSDMVQALRRGIRRGESLAAEFGMRGAPMTVGPRYTDELSGRRSVVLRTGRWSVQRVADTESDSETQLVPTEMLISSGSLIPLSAFKTLGLLDASLFIDHIDTDWCLRVRASGGWMAIVNDAHMSHQLGDRTVRIWLGGFRVLPVHSPLRLYYSFRNSLWLYVRPHAHWRWIGFDLKRLLATALIHAVADGPRGERFKMICLGIAHGIRGWFRV